MNAPPTWLLVLLAVALVVAALTVRDYEAEWRRRMVERTLNGVDAEGHFRTLTFAEANAERARTGDVPLEPYTWGTYWRDKRDGYLWVAGSLLS